MKNRMFKMLPLAAAIMAGPALAQQSNEEAISQLQTQVSALQQQLNAATSEDIHFNGFFSTGFARASNDAGFDGVTENSDVADQSLFGLQGTFDVTDKSQAVLQIMGRGEDDWDAEVEWAYLSYRPTNNTQVRAGKMRLPFFMYSDSLEVGYSQPWARAPQSVYGQVDIRSYVGADANYTLNLDSSSLTTQVFTGYTDESSPEDQVELRNSIGVNVTWTDYIWTLRGIAATAETTVDAIALRALADAQGIPLPPGPLLLADGDRGNFYGIGFGYDDGTWQILSEATRVEVKGEFADTDSAYLSVGRRFGSLTPYAVVGWIESKDNDERSGVSSVLNTRRDEYSAGVRWDVTPGIALKADITHVTGFDDDAGGLNPVYVASTNTDSTNVYTFKIDSAF